MDTQYKTSKFLRDLTKIYRKIALLLFSHQVSNLICILDTEANKVPKFSSEAQNHNALPDSTPFPTGQVWVHAPLMPLLRYVSSGKLVSVSEAQCPQNKYVHLIWSVGKTKWDKFLAWSKWLGKYNCPQFSSVAQSWPTICNPIDCSRPGLPVHCQLPEFTPTHVHWVDDTIQPTHPLSSPSPLAFNPSQHQGLFKWVSSLHPVVKVLEFQFQHQSFQWIFRVDFLYDGLVGYPCSPRDSQESSPTPQFKSINSLVLNFLYSPTLTSIHDSWKNHSFD